MKDKKFVVYEHISPCGKRYIRITSQKPEYRWHGGANYKSNDYFYKAIKKYGWNNFKHIILYSGMAREEACIKEIELINKYKTKDRKYGYNISLGGECSTLGLHWHKTKKQIQNQIKATTGLKRTSEQKERMSKSHRGLKQSEKQIEKRLNTIKKRYPNGINYSRRGKMIKCIETGKIYDSVKSAYEDLGLSHATLEKQIKNEKTRSNFHWEVL